MDAVPLGLTEPLDFDSDVPVYEQISNRIKFAIARQAYRPDTRLPSVRSLARNLVVNPNTIVRVYRDLEQEELIYSKRGVGVFVSPQADQRCRLDRLVIVEEKLREALEVARRANLNDKELEELWQRLRLQS
ncbi:MAG: GntR family transcriptional regulator [Planctomycetota bacterium]|nr:GntR family transcriptional regulator [Planctomycetota bacterium]